MAKRFFFHYNKANRLMSVHFGGQCHLAKNIDCHVPTETKWNTRQPNVVLRGWATSVTYNPKTSTITIT